MPFLFRRIAETFAASILCSVPVVMLIIIKIIPSTKLACFFAILLSAIIFLFINIVRLRMHISIVEDKAAYYRVNTVVFGVYALAATALILCRQGTALTWGFLPVKFLQAAGLKTILSAAAMYLLLFACIAGVSREYAKMVEMEKENANDPVELEWEKYN